MEEKRELYDKICKLLTWHEQENECPISKEQLKKETYSTLVDVQNFFCENYTIFHFICIEKPPKEIKAVNHQNQKR